MIMASFLVAVVVLCHNAHTSGFYACCYYFSTSEATTLETVLRGATDR